ncbi:hypothetical protein [Gottfriedia acidiceleris]|uniref:hypothetical protein n=1 Tax=Gottfriedia acidiceleris TaxID=371036 RepID=UPI002FFFF1F8
MAKKETMSIKEFMNNYRKKNSLHEESEKNDFFLQETKKEVLNLSFKDKKKLNNILHGFTATVLSLLETTTHAAASTTYTLPSEVTSGLQTLQFTCLAIAGSLATLCLMVSGMLKMLGLQEKVQNWNVNIVKGLIQVMTAPAVIFVMISLLKIILILVPGYKGF